MATSSGRRVATIVVALLVFGVPAGVAFRVIAGRESGGRMTAQTASSATTDLVYSTLTTEGNSENAEIYVRGEDGTALKVTEYPGPDFAPSLSPDGSKIAFVSDRDDAGNMDIYVVNADGSGVQRVTKSDEIDARPSWAPDGRQIAFARAAGDTFEIWVVDTVDRSERRLTTNDVDDFAPAWSPDGTAIAFQRYVGTNLELFTISPDGSSEKQLTELPGEDRDPVWSPDGTMIAFVRDAEENGQSAIYMLRVGPASAETPEAFPLTASSGARMNDPVWAADGTLVAFVSLGSNGYSIEARTVDGGESISPGLPDAVAVDLRDGYRLLGIDGTA